jgi:ribosomal protein S27E
MNKIVTCRTENCENQNISIIFLNPQDLVICGPCGQTITDKVDGEQTDESLES